MVCVFSIVVVPSECGHLESIHMRAAVDVSIVDRRSRLAAADVSHRRCGSAGTLSIQDTRRSSSRCRLVVLGLTNLLCCCDSVLAGNLKDCEHTRGLGSAPRVELPTTKAGQLRLRGREELTTRSARRFTTSCNRSHEP